MNSSLLKNLLLVLVAALSTQDISFLLKARQHKNISLLFKTIHLYAIQNKTTQVTERNGKT